MKASVRITKILDLIFRLICLMVAFLAVYYGQLVIALAAIFLVFFISKLVPNP